jgi:tetratricopeptide (TPR) repeat protein
MAEASVLSGDIGAASSISEQAMKLLDEVLQKRPESTTGAVRKAAQLGLQAGLLRDQGKSDEALEAFEQGITLLERQGSTRKPMVDFRLALLRWQKGRMLGFAGKKDSELELLGKARDMLRELEVKGSEAGPSAEELQRSSAYLLGDYAHALELANKEKEAKAVYREAIELWESLSKSRPQSEEYSEGLDWIRQRAMGLSE